jgi:hypothetical protein
MKRSARHFPCIGLPRNRLFTQILLCRDLIISIATVEFQSTPEPVTKMDWKVDQNFVKLLNSSILYQMVPNFIDTFINYTNSISNSDLCLCQEVTKAEVS